VRKPITPILKSFPIEIDSSLKPTKITEDSFSKIYQYLSELAGKINYHLSLSLFFFFSSFNYLFFSFATLKIRCQLLNTLKYYKEK